MISRIIVCLLLLNINALGGTEVPQLLSNIEDSSESIRIFVKALSQEQKDILKNFFQLVMKDRYTGYVLFGDKPICIEGYSPELEGIELPEVNQTKTYVNWMKLWHELEVLPENKNYFFIDLDAYGYHHIICINRQAFLKTVNQQLHLFRYVLDPTLTAEKLLQELIQAKEGFYDVLKYDNVLLGILLGYGTENALLVSRDEFIRDAFARDSQEDLPIIAKKIRFKQTKLPKMQSKRPSLGYDSLEDESDAVKKIITTSYRLNPLTHCEIPHFGCNPYSQETQELITTYTANRLTILEILESDNFLEEVLKKLFITTSKTFEIPKVPKSSSLSLNRETRDDSVAEFIYNDIKSKEYFDESYIKAYLEGMKAGQNGNYTSRFFKSEAVHAMVMEMWQTGKDLKRTKNLEKSDAYFNDPDFQQGLIVLIPKKVYYKVMKEGAGTPLSMMTKNVSFHYSCYSLNKDAPCHIGTLQEESIEHLIPGVGISLIGMKKGEVREVCIHPEYGYGENTSLEPNIIIIAKIELLDFSEGDEEVIFFPPHSLERKNFEEILTRYQNLCCKQFYDEGALFIDAVKKSKWVDSQAIQTCFDRLQNSIEAATPEPGNGEQYLKH